MQRKDSFILHLLLSASKMGNRFRYGGGQGGCNLPKRCHVENQTGQSVTLRVIVTFELHEELQTLGLRFPFLLDDPFYRVAIA